MKRESDYGGTGLMGLLSPALALDTFINPNSDVPINIPVPFNYWFK
jgi:hypothetical protein